MLPASGCVVIFRKVPQAYQTRLTADFATSASSISVADAAELLGTDTSATIAIGKNYAIEVTGVSGNTLTVTPETVLYPSTRQADGLESGIAYRSSVWRKDELYASAFGVAGGRFGSAVALWEDVCVVGAPFAEAATACCGSTQNADVRAGTAHVLQVRIGPCGF